MNEELICKRSAVNVREMASPALRFPSPSFVHATDIYSSYELIKGSGVSVVNSRIKRFAPVALKTVSCRRQRLNAGKAGPSTCHEGKYHTGRESHALKTLVD